MYKRVQGGLQTFGGTLDLDATGNTTFNSGGTLDIDATNDITLDSSKGDVKINAAADGKIRLGNKAVATDIELGNAIDKTENIKLNSKKTEINANITFFRSNCRFYSPHVTDTFKCKVKDRIWNHQNYLVLFLGTLSYFT